MHADLLLPLLHFVHIGMEQTGDWRKQSSKTNKLFETVSSPGSCPMGFFQTDPQTGQSLVSWSPGLWSWDLLCFFLSESSTPPATSLQPRLPVTFTVLTIPALFVSRRPVSSRWLLDHLCQEVVIGAVQSLPRLLVPCVLPPADNRLFKVPHEDQALQIWGLIYFSWLDSLQWISTTPPPILLCPLNLIHKLVHHLSQSMSIFLVLMHGK